MADQCYAGTLAFFGGKWMGMPPCTEDAIHVIATDERRLPLIKLCEKHFQEVLAAGMVDDPYVGTREDWERKYGRRLEPESEQ